MRIAIAGYGLEGEASYRYWSTASEDNEVIIVDQRQPDRELPRSIEAIIGENAFDALDGFDLVIRTPSLSPNKIKTNGKIWSATNEFFDKCPAPIVGVTGTKGKGTTASLIASILKSAGKKVWLIGNIGGEAALDVLGKVTPGDVVVYELSSFQLWDIEKSPQAAVVLFIEQEHLDIHSSMEEYLDAKSNIGRYQKESDTLVYNRNNRYATEIAGLSPAKKVGFPDQDTAHIQNDNFYYGEQKICSVDTLNIPGVHNQENTCAAIDAVWEFTDSVSVIEEGIKGFKGLPHRLQFVRDVGGVEYYDDSIATTPSATIAALRSFNKPKIIILGGSFKGSDFDELGQELTKHSVQAILIGKESTAIAKSCKKAGFMNFEVIEAPTMNSVVNRAHELAAPGSVVLLSPASASFGLFKDYIDRGDQFQKAVRDL